MRLCVSRVMFVLKEIAQNDINYRLCDEKVINYFWSVGRH